nr:immunoglobulin heavy chain junction region [Mus musculus]
CARHEYDYYDMDYW